MSPIEHQPFLKYHDDPAVENHNQDLQLPTRSSRNRQFVSHALVFTTTSLLWVLAFLFMLPSPSPPSPPERKPIDMANLGKHILAETHNITSDAKLVTCGGSVQEARALGCKYDILLNSWVPAPCLDQEFIDEYTDDNSWGAFADENLTQQLTVDQMSESHHYYTSRRDHVNHCAIMWRRQFWALFELRPAIDTMSASPGHTDHCSQYLMEASESNSNDATRVEVVFAGCWVKE